MCVHKAWDDDFKTRQKKKKLLESHCVCVSVPELLDTKVRTIRLPFPQSMANGQTISFHSQAHTYFAAASHR